MTDALGSAAPQCGQCGPHESEDDRTGVRRSQMRRSQARGWYSRGYLPHFDMPHLIQHITYRLADALPLVVLERKRTEVKTTLQDDEKRKTALRVRIEEYIDAGHGSCVLRIPEIAACVVDTWLRFDGERYRLLEWVVMPNHCHVLIEPFEGVPLGKIVLSWKNYTARFINLFKAGCVGSAAPQCGSQENEEGRTGGASRPQVWRSQVWQREYWDRFIRNERHLAAAKEYITMNPVKAGLVAKPEDWPWGSMQQRGDSDGRE